MSFDVFSSKVYKLQPQTGQNALVQKNEVDTKENPSFKITKTLFRLKKNKKIEWKRFRRNGKKP